MESKYIESKELMKQFIKTIPARHSIARTLRRQHGPEAYAFLTILLDLAQDIGVYELTPDIIAQECGIKTPKISRIFNDLKNAYEESLRILGLIPKKVENKSNKVQDIPDKVENIPNLTEQSSEYSEESSELYAQNPHGSTRDQEENRVEEKRERGEKNSPWIQKCVELANGYAENSINNQQTGWISGYLRNFFILNRTQWSALADDDIYACWVHACKSWDKGRRYLEAVFERSLSEFNPSKRLKVVAIGEPQITHAEKLMAAKRIRNVFDHTEYNTADLTMDNHKQIFHDGIMVNIREFEPVEEEATA